jgi:hypothetical protein
VRDNTLLHQTNAAVHLDTVGGATLAADVLNNTMTGPGAAGSSSGVAYFSLGGGTGSALIFGNTISEHRQSGINVNSSPADAGPVTVKANTLFRNGTGIFVNYPATRVENNKVNGNFGNGIEVFTAGHTFLSNNAKSNTGIDCVDHSTGGGTASTGNTWTGNYGLESSPVGICKP